MLIQVHCVSNDITERDGKRKKPHTAAAWSIAYSGTSTAANEGAANASSASAANAAAASERLATSKAAAAATTASEPSAELGTS